MKYDHTLNNHTQEQEEITDIDDKYWGGWEWGKAMKEKIKKTSWPSIFVISTRTEIKESMNQYRQAV
jgi:hypothetical protein